MAVCENCNLGGFLPQDMRADAYGRMLIGPCCVGKDVRPVDAAQELDIEYGVEVSSKRGLKAYINAGGLSIQFRKSPSELKELFDGVN